MNLTRDYVWNLDRLAKNCCIRLDPDKPATKINYVTLHNSGVLEELARYST